MTGTMDSLRFRRLADRVIAIDMARRGADFREFWQYFREQDDSPSDAFDHAQRINRGGVLTGGAPFTKDIVYLEGLLRIQAFFSDSIANGRVAHIHALFAGKLDLADVPDIARLIAAGTCKKARYLPPWIVDLDRLRCFFSYTNFLNRVTADANGDRNPD